MASGTESPECRESEGSDELIRNRRTDGRLDGIFDASKVGWSLSLPRAGHVGDSQSERVDI